MAQPTAFQRARTDEQRAARRAIILETTLSLLTTTRVADLTLNELARTVGLAKSNVLRYFESREAILLELYDREYAAWLDALDVALAGIVSIEPIADVMAQTISERPIFCDLCASAPGVLEHNVSAEVAAAYKRSAVANAERLGALVLPRLGVDSFASGIVFVGGVNIIVGGVWANSQPSTGMAAAYEANPDLRAMRVNLGYSLRELLATLLVGVVARTPRTS
ncbi:TetR/AcrR family transcriptional regulator [Subtercola endophyticus]|uniref:TetR/AcrR family transcriptional regulator n=1 Tax=Subtercola endophyticus TaxID=2895559 RepID=UPI001E35EBDE|nr:TetR family transcriptional regulator [Subtercola endophyticus]UFS60224.1 TetR family transcriptional regulator [Subtercola endophyticus]